MHTYRAGTHPHAPFRIFRATHLSVLILPRAQREADTGIVTRAQTRSRTRMMLPSNARLCAPGPAMCRLEKRRKKMRWANRATSLSLSLSLAVARGISKATGTYCICSMHQE